MTNDLHLSSLKTAATDELLIELMSRFTFAVFASERPAHGIPDVSHFQCEKNGSLTGCIGAAHRLCDQLMYLASAPNEFDALEERE